MAYNSGSSPVLPMAEIHPMAPKSCPGSKLLLSRHGALCGPTSVHEGDGMRDNFSLTIVDIIRTW